MSLRLALSISAVLLLVLGTGAGYLFGYDHGYEKAIAPTTISSFADCVAAGYPIRESYPEQCAMPDGTVFTRAIAETPTGEEVFCTQDAMECPDGSYVGRTGPNCEFAPCPGN
jgi:hypothetical protein